MRFVKCPDCGHDFNPKEARLNRICKVLDNPMCFSSILNEFDVSKATLSKDLQNLKEDGRIKPVLSDSEKKWVIA